jgi:hypothetical protein
MRDLIIRSLATSERKRPDAGEQFTRSPEVRRICLLELFRPGEGLAQRRAIEVNRGQGTVWREYEIVRSFSSPDEAIAYANEHGIADVKF